MRIFHQIQSLRDALKAERGTGKRIGFVPTMGNLHDGHIALIKQAQTACDVVVCSIFVNGLQFGLNEDWDKYPRTFREDCDKLKAAGCDYLFNPDDNEMYPNGLDTQTRVICPTMTDVLCGASRPGHFEGVTTVVTKLFNIVQPDEAVFGIKDYQQLAVIRRMAEDLCIPIQITAAPIHREADGLAMSSRNSYLKPEERTKVSQLQASLQWAAAQIKAGEKDFDVIELEAKSQIIAAGFRPDYFSICNSKTLAQAAHDDKNITILGAMFTQSARLIDNLSIELN
ncbi:pantoate--beta-alanine ligase [Simiduia curdlanivorans]|uniref:Pantothenate synthetase n=1 Tax=Simiduia curdlanivorans TaxID=1492769 RepID=A0ABV8V3A2_9GAMM|nr:pantoate--beta-alanine ligase [Simiduia curdlanivorans]MDN3638306.1 pantoate--beta-alanine ligase [Simiduia curdlanivorans]